MHLFFPFHFPSGWCPVPRTVSTSPEAVKDEIPAIQLQARLIPAAGVDTRSDLSTVVQSSRYGSHDCPT